jgi:transposase/predicted nucleic acid-binding Zn finger protein
LLVIYSAGSKRLAEVKTVGIREKKGQAIAERAGITRKGNLYLVPSQGRGGHYTVDADAGRCSCPDFEFRQAACKHIYAVQVTIERTQTVTTTMVETAGGKATVTETVSTETVKVKRTTYRQEWKQYNAAQAYEKSEFLALLHGLTNGVDEPVQTFGRPRLSMADTLFAVVYKIYSNVSTRRFASDLRDAYQKGYLSKLPSYNTIFDYLQMESLTPYLQSLIAESSKALKAVETDFAVDSSGFSTGQFIRWMDVKYGQKEDARQWLKLHLMCGVRTNVVTSVEVSGGHSNDYPYFKTLVDKTAQSGFTMKEVSADKAYLGAGNFAATLKHGAIPYIPFKTNSQPDGNGALWQRIYHFYNFQRDEFLKHYHKRSNVETTFSMIKAKFGQRLRAKTPVAQMNEALCKVLCHNICCVIQSIHELG